MEDLKLCPFCGGKATMQTARLEKSRKNPTKIICDYCGASTKVYPMIRQAKAAWNRRVNNGRINGQ